MTAYPPIKGETMSLKYRWECEHDWLGEKIGKTNDPEELRQIINHMASVMDHDQLGDLFQPDMVDDGYYTPMTPKEIERRETSESLRNEQEPEHPLKSSWSWMATIHLAIAADDLPTEGHVCDWISGVLVEDVMGKTGELLGWGYAKIGAQWQYPTRQHISFDEHGELIY